MSFRNFFHRISYLQYPLMIAAMYFIFKPMLINGDLLKDNPQLLIKGFNSALVFFGLAISFSSLQDTTKTQNKLSKRIWENPIKGKVMIVLMFLMIVFWVTYGLIGYFIADAGYNKDISIGAIVLGLGMFGLLKTMIEMFENQRLDKNPCGQKEGLELKSIQHLKNEVEL